VPKYLIEVPHDPDELACAKVIQVFLSSGSHFLSNAEWGCGDGVHNAWMIVDTANRQEAMAIVPPAFRAVTKIVMDDLEPIFRRHGLTAKSTAAADDPGPMGETRSG